MSHKQLLQIPTSTTIHYAYPTITIIYFVLTQSLSWCIVRSDRWKEKMQRRRFLITLGLMLSALLTYVVEAALLISHTLTDKNGWFAPRDHIIYIMSAILVWGIIVLVFADSSSSVEYPYFGCWILGAVSESTLTLANADLWRAQNSFDTVGLVLEVIRALIFVLALSTALPGLYRSTGLGHTHDESRSLLDKAQNQLRYGSAGCSDDQAVKKDNGDEEELGTDVEVDFMKKQQKKRLEESGSWWSYLKGFLIFLPYVWPSQDRSLQGFLAFKILSSLGERALNVLIPRQLGIITNALAAEGPSVPWKAVALWMLFSYLNSSAGLYLLYQLGDIKLDQYSYRKITNAAFAQVMRLSLDFHNDKDAAEITKAIDQGRSLGEIRDCIVFDVLPVGLDIFVAVGYFTYLFDAYAGLILAAVIVTYVWIGIKTEIYEGNYRKKYNEKSREEWKIMHEAVDNWETVSYFNRFKYEEQRMATAMEEASGYKLRYRMTYKIGFGLQSLVSTLGFLGISFLVIYRISIGLQPVGTFVTMSAYWAIVTSPLRGIAWTHARLVELLVDAERLLQLLQQKPSVVDREDASALKLASGRVEFTNVSFSYDPRKSTLRDISFVAEGGKTIALVGKTGAGKSSIFKLLSRFYDVTGGSIRIDDQDVRDVTLDSLREVLGVVPQDPSLFNMSIMDNVRYARSNATDHEVHEACRAAAIHDKILTFPDGYNSKVGQRGVKLSGGELQRVAIARAVLKNSRIILLDEATSAVDTETEQHIQEAFRRLSKGRTTFVIAHRLSTIVQADIILVIDDGKIIERGTHHELFQAKGKYYSMWSKQINRAADEETPPTFLADITDKDLKAAEADMSRLDTVIDNQPRDAARVDEPAAVTPAHKAS